MQTATKISALREIRKDTIRADLPHVVAIEAMLRHYGAEPGNGAVRPARPNPVGNNAMRWMLKDALKGGEPKPLSDLVAYVMARRPELSLSQARQRTGQALRRMAAKGMAYNIRYGLWAKAGCQIAKAG